MARTAYAFGLAWLLAACGSAPAGEGETSGDRLSANDSLFSVRKGPYAFELLLPKDLMINYPADIRLNEATGNLEIALGPDFALEVSAERKNMEEVRSNLDADGIFTSRVEVEDPNYLIYQQILPDGRPYFYHFQGLAEVSGNAYLVRSSPMGEYSRRDVERMATVFLSFAAGKEPA